MNREECLQCGAVMTDAACDTCDAAGKKEVIAMVTMMVLIALALALYTSTKLV